MNTTNHLPDVHAETAIPVQVHNPKRLYVHIGYNKAGSSSIQANLHENRAAYARSGIYYPKAGIFDNAHYGLSKHVLSLPDHPKIDASMALLEQCTKEIRKSGCDTVILSSEYLSVANKGHVEKFREVLGTIAEGYDVFIVVYLRRHDLWFESLFNQAEKTNATPTWEMDIRDFVLSILGSASPQVSYLQVIKRWAAVFGNESMIVRPFEPAQFIGGSLIKDFFSAIGHEAAAIEDARATVNISLDPAVLYAIGLVKRNLPSTVAQSLVPQLVGAATHIDNACPPGYGKFNARHRRSIYRFFLPEYQEIARRYMGRKHGKLFVDVPEQP